MRVVDRKTFLGLPAGTIYCKGKPWYFEGLCIKGDSLSDDWIYLGPEWVQAHDSGEATRRLDEMLEAGASYPMEDSWGRDGCFDHEEIFLVFERDDLLSLRGHIDAALASCDGSPEGVKTQSGLIEDDSAVTEGQTPLPSLLEGERG